MSRRDQASDGSDEADDPAEGDARPELDDPPERGVR